MTILTAPSKLKSSFLLRVLVIHDGDDDKCCKTGLELELRTLVRTSYTVAVTTKKALEMDTK